MSKETKQIERYSIHESDFADDSKVWCNTDDVAQLESDYDKLKKSHDELLKWAKRYDHYTRGFEIKEYILAIKQAEEL